MTKNKKPKERIIINSLPKAGNNLLASILEEKGYKRSDVWGISSMEVLRPTYASATLRNSTQQPQQGMIAGLFLPVERSIPSVVNQLNAVLPGEYIITHMPNQFLSLALSGGFEVHHVQRPLIEVVESYYHDVHAHPDHPLYQIFTKEKDMITKYEWVIYGKMWMDLNLLSVYEADLCTHMYKTHTAVRNHEYEELWKVSEQLGTKKHAHAFRKGTPQNYKETMPEQVQELFV